MNQQNSATLVIPTFYDHWTAYSNQHCILGVYSHGENQNALIECPQLKIWTLGPLKPTNINLQMLSRRMFIVQRCTQRVEIFRKQTKTWESGPV